MIQYISRFLEKIRIKEIHESMPILDIQSQHLSQEDSSESNSLYQHAWHQSLAERKELTRIPRNFFSFLSVIWMEV